MDLAINGTVLYPKGTVGEVLKVLRENELIQYHVYFPGKTLQVPETALEAFEAKDL